MASIIQICNIALLMIGHDRINALDEDSKAARLCNEIYPISRDATIRAHPWAFARWRASLASSASVTPAFEYTQACELPNDFLRLLRLENTQSPFTVEGGFIMANFAPINIKYLRRVEDTAKFDSLFVDALAARMSADLAASLARSREDVERQWQLYQLKVREAKFVNAAESDGPNEPDQTGWLEARDGDWRGGTGPFTLVP